MNDPVLKILKQYLISKKEEENYDYLSKDEKDRFRLENDDDARYYYKNLHMTESDALFADVIVSFWTPYRWLLEKKTGWNAYKTDKSLKSLIYQIETNKKTDYNDKIRQVNSSIEDFARICYSKGNFMLLPKRMMNNERYKLTEDKIDLTLYECFENGKLSKYFESDDKLKEWIKRQNLNILFKNNIIARSEINWFVPSVNKKLFSEMSAEEICEYLEKATQFIKQRNEM